MEVIQLFHLKQGTFVHFGVTDVSIENTRGSLVC